MYPCSLDCGDSFDTRQGLSNHQRRCEIYNAEGSDDDGEDIPAKFQELRERKRQKLQPAPPDLLAGSSSAVDHSQDSDMPVCIFDHRFGMDGQLDFFL
jgi:hypothetical protein